MSEAAIQAQLDLIETHVQLAKKDLESGDLVRVGTALQTIAYVSGQSIDMVRASKADGKTTVTRRGAGGRPKSDKSKQLDESIIGILQEQGEVHIGDLMDELTAQDVALPGAGKPANLIAHMRRMSEVQRVRRGVYGLTKGE